MRNAALRCGTLSSCRLQCERDTGPNLTNVCGRTSQTVERLKVRLICLLHCACT